MAETHGLTCFHCKAPIIAPAGATQIVCTYCGQNSLLSKPVISAGVEGENWCVRLETVGSKKIAVIKAVREFSGLGLKESKELVESAPLLIATDRSHEGAEAIERLLTEAGARVSLSQS